MRRDARSRNGALLLVLALLSLAILAASHSRGQGLPDIAIADADLSVSRMDPVRGEPFTLYARVRNVGEGAGNATVRFYVGDLPADWFSVGERNVSVAAGASAVASLNLTLPAGIHRVSAQALNVTPRDADPGNQFGTTVIEVFASREGAVFLVPTLLLEGAIATIASGQTSTVSLNATAKGGRVMGASLEVLEATGVLAVPAGPPIDIEPNTTVRLELRVTAPHLPPGVNLSWSTHLVHAVASNARGNTVTLRVAVTVAPTGAPENAQPWAPVALAAAVGLIGVLAAVASVEAWRHRFFLLLLPLYSRLRKEDVLDQYTRGKIHGYLLANPGDYFTSIAKALGLSGGVLAYHLRVLEREGEIVSRQDGVHKRFYPAGARTDGDPGDALSPIQRSVCRAIQETPGIRQKEIAALLGVSAATVSYHLQKLVARGLIKGVRKGMAVRYYPATAST